VVKLELVPLEGAPSRTTDELDEVAASLREELRDHACAANGSGDRFVVSAKIETEDAAAAEAWAREEVYSIVSDFLPDWRLDHLTSWAE
jgi:hypothetical protein